MRLERPACVLCYGSHDSLSAIHLLLCFISLFHVFVIFFFLVEGRYVYAYYAVVIIS